MSGVPDGAQELQVRRVDQTDLPLPSYGSDFAAGLDLRAAVTEDVEIAPGERRLIPTGIAVALPRGHEGQVRPRSGLALKFGITVLNAPGTIDEDFRGEIGVVLVNHGAEPFLVRRADRIAQLVVAPVARVLLRETDRLDETVRGAGGYGSTGRS